MVLTKYFRKMHVNTKSFVTCYKFPQKRKTALENDDTFRLLGKSTCSQATHFFDSDSWVCVYLHTCYLAKS